MDIQFNGLMDIILLETSKEEIADLSEVIKDNLGLSFNFFSQKENYDYFNEYYLHSHLLKAVNVAINATLTKESIPK